MNNLKIADFSLSWLLIQSTLNYINALGLTY